MHTIPVLAPWPDAWLPNRCPPIDELRPHACPRCHSPARDGDRILLHGHGSRTRGVVVHPALDDRPPRIEDAWVRRFRCTQCHAVLSVFPPGVLPRFLYSLLAIVRAWFLTAKPPLGKGLSEKDAYQLQGMYRTPRCRSAWPYRWRSLLRWARRIPAWWPTRPASTPVALIAGWRAEAGGELRALLDQALHTHLQGGAAM